MTSSEESRRNPSPRPDSPGSTTSAPASVELLQHIPSPPRPVAPFCQLPGPGQRQCCSYSESVRGHSHRHGSKATPLQRPSGSHHDFPDSDDRSRIRVCRRCHTATAMMMPVLSGWDAAARLSGSLPARLTLTRPLATVTACSL